MTVPSTINRNDYTGNGATAVYPYTYRVFSNTDLLVTVRDDAVISTQYTLVLGTDYTVSGVGGASGNVTLVNAGQTWLTGGFLKTAWTLTIRRVRPLTQTTDIRNGGPFFAATHEDVFDILTMLSQQLQDQVNRSLKLKETEAGSVAFTQIPIASERASKVLGFDGSGNVVAVSSVPTSGVTVSAYIQTLLDDASAAIARGTLVISAEISPGSIGANQNDYAGVTTDGSVVLGRLTASGAFNITGFTGGAVDKVLILVNIGANAITLTHQDALSVAANRIIGINSANVVLTTDMVTALKYDAITARWRALFVSLIDTSQIKDAAITAAKLNVSAINGQTAETDITLTDELLVYDVSAAALRKATTQNAVKVAAILYGLLGGA